jgi:chromosome segregation ATPase
MEEYLSENFMDVDLSIEFAQEYLNATELYIRTLEDSISKYQFNISETAEDIRQLNEYKIKLETSIDGFINDKSEHLEYLLYKNLYQDRQKHLAALKSLISNPNHLSSPEATFKRLNPDTLTAKKPFKYFLRS